MRAMKDSGIEWIGEIPETWSISRLKYNLSAPMKYGASESGIEFSDNLPRYIRITDITSDNKLKEDGKLSLAFQQAKEYMLERDTVLFARSGATVGKTFLYTKDYGSCAFAGYLISGIPDDKKMLAKWLWYFSQSSSYWNWTNQIFTQATIQNIGADKYSNLPIPVPSIIEQHEIIKFLDEKCFEIDSLTKNIEGQIEKLEEYKKSVITEVITKGLNPVAEMKESGVRWIGLVSKDAEIIKLKHFSYMKGRIGWQGLKATDFIDEGPYCVTGTDFINGKVNWNTCYHVSEERYEMDNKIHIKVGDLLMTKDGTIGKLALIDELPGKACLNSHLLIIRPLLNKYLNKYLFYVMKSHIFSNYYNLISFGSIMDSISQEKTGNFSIPIYDIDMQQKIVDYLDSTCLLIDNIISDRKSQFEMLKKYKETLIYECVTGKKEV